MTVKKLKELLSGFSDDLEVVYASFDGMGDMVEPSPITEMVINVDHELLILR